MADYIAIIHKEKKSEYGVSFSDFPGCITAGKTIDEAKNMAHKALEFHVDGLLKDGEQLPEPTPADLVQFKDALALFIVSIEEKREPVRINISIDPYLLDKADKKSRKEGVTRSGFISQALKHELNLSD